MTRIKKGIYLSLVCALSLQAAQVDLGTIDVEGKVDTEIIRDVHGEDIKSADLAEALFKQSPSISLSRRSGIANDILVRGQRKDNINVTIDGAKVCGACPNRMDPPISHVLTNNVDYIEINEGPYNVEDFGVLSADIKIHTIKPGDEFEGEVNIGIGGWGSKKASFIASGAIIENVKFLLSASTESSGQYEDGNGDDFVGQIARNIREGHAPAAAQYNPVYQDKDAYSKKTLLTKLFWEIADNQELRLSYTGNRSDNILYPSSKMDAISDDSDIYNIEYIAKDLGRYSKELVAQYYQSTVNHPMSTIYRKSAAAMGFEMTHELDTEMQGAKIKNSFDLDNHTITGGLDYSLRNWDGGYYKNGIPLPVKRFHSIWNVDTENYALFLKDEIKMDKLVLDLGLRYNDTKITSDNPKQQDNDYNELNGYIFGTYHATENTKYFAGFGKSSRVPDGKELYWIGSMGNPIGTPDLDDTINYEFDLGVEMSFDDLIFKAKGFYSMLDDYIAYNASNVNKMGAPQYAYENVDATIYGFELSGTYIASEAVYFDYGMAYQRGKKDHPLKGQLGTNMPEIPPFKMNLAGNYDWDESLTLRAELIASDDWTRYDAENGEQELGGYGVLNIRGRKDFGKNFELIVGIDNLFDKTYAVSNTYKDLILLGTPGETIMLMNEPGRYVYANMKFKF